MHLPVVISKRIYIQKCIHMHIHTNIIATNTHIHVYRYTCMHNYYTQRYIYADTHKNIHTDTHTVSHRDTNTHIYTHRES